MISLESLIKSIHAAIMTANDQLTDNKTKLFDSFFENASSPEDDPENEGVLRPKTVTIQYPEPTSNGVKLHNVEVPLITLVPISTSEISEVKLHTQLEMVVVNDELQVGFAPNKMPDQKHKSSRRLFETSPAPSDPSQATLEITITPQKCPEGLSRLIAGYEKILRAQIPV